MGFGHKVSPWGTKGPKIYAFSNNLDANGPQKLAVSILLAREYEKLKTGGQSQWLQRLCEVAELLVFRYGRMSMGRCLTSNAGSVGCTRDVLPQIDSVCSGQRTCQLDVRDLLIHNPCAKDLRGYLEVRYACLTGIVHPMSGKAPSHRFCWRNLKETSC